MSLFPIYSNLLIIDEELIKRYNLKNTLSCLLEKKEIRLEIHSTFFYYRKYKQNEFYICTNSDLY